MKKIITFVMCIAAAAVLALSFPCGASADTANDTDFTTVSYNVNIDLKTNDTAYVTEKIKVKLNDYTHCLYRNIPVRQEATYRDSDGDVVKTENLPMKISDVGVKGAAFSTYNRRGKTVIRIGDKDEYMNGTQTFTVTYRVKMYKDRTAKYDSFCYEILPYDWGSEIEKSKVTVDMPKSVEKDNITVTAGDEGSEKSDKVKWDLDENTITIRTVDTLKEGEGIEVGVMLPDGYFSDAASTGWMHYIEYGVCILVIILLIMMYLKFGRDPKHVQQIEFEPPAGMTTAEYGYIVDGRADRRDIYSLLLYWSELGYISIGEEPGGGFTIYKERELPADAKPYERTFFNALFPGMTTELPLSEVGPDMGEQIEVSRAQLKKGLSSKKSRIYSRSVSFPRILATALGVIALAVPGVILYVLYGSLFFFMIFAVAALLLIPAYIISFIAADRREVPQREKFARNLFSVLLVLVSAGICLFGLIKLQTDIIAGIGFALVAIAGFISTRYMRKRTKLGADIYARVLGYRRFIQSADEEKVSKICEDDPDFFFDTMPFAYTMGLEKKWAAKFRHFDIGRPRWYKNEGGPEQLSAESVADIADRLIKSFESQVGLTPLAKRRKKADKDGKEDSAE
ncbi:MAG: DUF2207 domain-containing protein [Anaerovoracaceae bacterium]